MTEAEMIAWINQASLVELLRRWRFSEGGPAWFQGDVGQHFSKVLFRHRNADPDAWVRASKEVGW